MFTFYPSLFVLHVRTYFDSMRGLLVLSPSSISTPFFCLLPFCLSYSACAHTQCMIHSWLVRANLECVHQCTTLSLDWPLHSRTIKPVIIKIFKPIVVGWDWPVTTASSWWDGGGEFANLDCSSRDFCSGNFSSGGFIVDILVVKRE